MASVRFICGTQELHKRLEGALSDFLGTDDTILFSSCFDANGGVFEVLFGERGRDHLRRAQPRLPHRRHPAVQGRPLPLPRTPTWPTSRPSWSRRRAARTPLHRHRRRLLDGRLPRSAGPDLRPGRAVRRPGAGRRLARRRASWVPAAAAPPSTSGCSDRVDILTGTLGKALGRRLRRLRQRPRRDRRPAPPAGPALPVLERRRARRWPPARSGRLELAAALAASARATLAHNTALFRG